MPKLVSTCQEYVVLLSLLTITLVCSIIKTSDFRSPEALASHLHFLVKNPDQYEQLLQWKKLTLDPFPGFAKVVELSVDTAHCRLCAKLRPGRCSSCGLKCLQEQESRYDAVKNGTMSWSTSHERVLK